MVQHFIDRERELSFLERKYRESGAQFIVVYGRRRVGKTELVKKFLSGKRGVYMLCTRDSVGENIKELRRKLYELTGKRYFLMVEASLYELLKLLAEEVREKRVVVALDEFPYLLELDSGLTSVLQKAWDEALSKTGIYLILCGSSIGMMETEVLGYKSPLYGRRTGSWKLTPLEFKHIRHFLPEYSTEELVKAWCILGGVPYYLKQFTSSKSIEENIREKILTKGEVLYSEPQILLREEFREPRVYTLVLKYISLGYTTLGALSSATGINRANLSKYLSTLEETEIIEHILPLGRRKRGQYIIKDPFFNFWFKFVYPNQSDLELGLVDEVYQRISQQLDSYYGAMFERLVSQLVKTRELKLPHPPATVAKWWHKDTEVDVVAVDPQTAQMTLIEVKWSKLTRRQAQRIILGLKEKAGSIPWRREERREHYGVIAREVEGKESLRAQGYIAYDLGDVLHKDNR